MQASFLPALIFPFVKLHALGGTPLHSEATFEMLATLLISWMRGRSSRVTVSSCFLLSWLSVNLTTVVIGNNERHVCQYGVEGVCKTCRLALIADMFPDRRLV
jgi:hypothetical protein